MGLGPHIPPGQGLGRTNATKMQLLKKKTKEWPSNNVKRHGHASRDRERRQGDTAKRPGGQNWRRAIKRKENLRARKGRKQGAKRRQGENHGKVIGAEKAGNAIAIYSLAAQDKFTEAGGRCWKEPLNLIDAHAHVN